MGITSPHVSLVPALLLPTLCYAIRGAQIKPLPLCLSTFCFFPTLPHILHLCNHLYGIQLPPVVKTGCESLVWSYVPSLSPLTRSFQKWHYLSAYFVSPTHSKMVSVYDIKGQLA